MSMPSTRSLRFHHPSRLRQKKNLSIISLLFQWILFLHQESQQEFSLQFLRHQAQLSALPKKPKINKRPPAVPSGLHICDPVDLAIKLSDLACSDKLSEAKGGFSRVCKGKNNPSGESCPSLLCKTYLFGLSCDGSTSCGYHLHVNEKLINGPLDSYQPL